MLIDKELIIKAKEKLGDKNATIMAEMLGLEDFDERNLKSRCPYHLEDTPSFIYNKKNYSFHCFGCQKTVDIIDVYMQRGYTYIGAVQKLFEIAEMPYSFGEHNVKTKVQYKYPKEEDGTDKEQVYKYLNNRKISKETVDYADVRQDKHGNCVFNFYDSNDVLTMVKYRLARNTNKARKEVKCWCQKDADTFPLLFNMNRINTTQPLLICEGEIDCLSAIESGFLNAVSIPLGAGNFHWIKENWEWLQQFESIIICSDNDEAGIKMQKECIYRLGSWRTKIVQVPEFYQDENGEKLRVTDLNEVLYYYGKEKVIEIILSAKDSPVDSVVNFSDIKEVDLSEIDGVYTGIKEFDQEMMRLFYGTFNIVTGVNGAGKSSFLSQLVCQSVQQGKDAWMYSKELPNYMSKNWINYILAGRRHVKEYTTERGAVYYKVTNEAKNKIDQYYNGHIYIYKDGYPNTVEDIEKSMEDSARKFGSKLFIIDNLTAINLGCSETEKWGKQVDFVNFLIDFAQRFHVVVILVIHPKKIETMRRLQKFDVAGLGSIVDLAHRLISLYRVTPKEKKGVRKANGSGWATEPIKYDVLVDVLKDRMRGRENLAMGLYYDVPSRRFYTNKQEFGYQYAWDNEIYKDEIPYPYENGYIDTSQQKEEEDEVFGRI